MKVTQFVIVRTIVRTHCGLILKATIIKYTQHAIMQETKIEMAKFFFIEISEYRIMTEL